MASLLPLLLVAGFILGPSSGPGKAPQIRITRVKVVRARSVHRRAVKPKPAKPVPEVPLPRAVDDWSLGFGSTPDDVQRLLGKPTRVAKGMNGAVWFYSLSTVTMGKGRVVGWSTYDHPLPVNIGAPEPGARAPKLGSTTREVVAARGTPNTVAVQGGLQVWFYGTYSYTLRRGRVVPTSFGAPDGPAKAPDQKQAAPARAASTASAAGAHCHCAL